MSETAKHRALVAPYCTGNGVDLGSAGDLIAPHAISIELPAAAYHGYNTTRAPLDFPHYGGSAFDLPFKDATLDFVHASHLLEDKPESEWPATLREWDRVLKVGGYLIIAVPDETRFRAYVQRHAELPTPVDVDNRSHRHESRIGELTRYLCNIRAIIRYDAVVEEQFATDDPNEYSIVGVFQKL